MFQLLSPYEGYIVFGVAVILAYRFTRWMIRQGKLAQSQKAVLKRLPKYFTGNENNS